MAMSSGMQGAGGDAGREVHRDILIGHFGCHWKKYFGMVMAIAMGFVAVHCFMPSIRRNPHPRNVGIAIKNARMIAFALSNFVDQYGQFPDGDTAAIIDRFESIGKRTLTGPYSNGYFRQLTGAGAGLEEGYFLIPRHPENHRVDGIMDGDRFCAPGEVDFAYFLDENGTGALGPAGRVVLAGPMLDSTRLDPRPLNGKAVVMLADLSVRLVPVQADGFPWLGDGIPLADVPGDRNWGNPGRPVVKPPAPTP